MPLHPSRIKRTVQKVLKREGVQQAHLSLAFVTDRKIRALNRRYLDCDETTDVLAFDLSDQTLSKSKKGNIKILEGEVIICGPTVYNNAKRFGTKPSQELILCVIHGILHLLGYDDHSPREIKRMRDKERELLTKIGLRDE